MKNIKVSLLLGRKPSDWQLGEEGDLVFLAAAAWRGISASLRERGREYQQHRLTRFLPNVEHFLEGLFSSFAVCL